ncbi:MAG: DUF4252 domain-containing protein [Bacteroidota bacterium]
MRIYTAIIIFLMISIQGAFAQEGPLKKFTEENTEASLPRFSKICLYPSTLRMINISQNQDYNELVSDIDKILIYVLSPEFLEATDVHGFLKTYRDMGYEEYASVKSSTQNLVILGEGSEKVIGLLGGENMGNSLLFYMKGQINWQKIPALMETLKSNEVVDIFNFREGFN